MDWLEPNARSHGAALRVAQELSTVRLDQSPMFSAHSTKLHFLIRNTILVVEDASDQMRIPATSLMLALLGDL
jgi:hypothetical protein